MARNLVEHYSTFCALVECSPGHVGENDFVDEHPPRPDPRASGFNLGASLGRERGPKNNGLVEEVRLDAEGHLGP